ncbi:hypothetical protein GCM10007235_24210 [Pseudoxanthomonas indica]|nr:hypothetical protein GCM10007235_24210 [Pseudoxanthomonas indica]
MVVAGAVTAAADGEGVGTNAAATVTVARPHSARAECFAQLTARMLSPKLAFKTGVAPVSPPGTLAHRRDDALARQIGDAAPTFHVGDADRF